LNSCENRLRVRRAISSSQIKGYLNPWSGSRGQPHLVDSTGIKVRGEGEWHARKHGGARRREWRKVHLGIDEATMEVRAVEITGSGVGDAPMLVSLLSQIRDDEPVASVTADGAYDGRACRDAIASRGAEAIIPPRRNAKPWKKDSPGANGRNEALRAIKRFGRTLWRKWSGYHRRSRVETKMNCMKLLGQKLAARDFDRQTAELQVRIAILNRFTALGIPVTQPVG
jgi:transposase